MTDMAGVSFVAGGTTAAWSVTVGMTTPGLFTPAHQGERRVSVGMSDSSNTSPLFTTPPPAGRRGVVESVNRGGYGVRCAIERSYLTPLTGRLTVKSRRTRLKCECGVDAPFPASGSIDDPAQDYPCTRPEGKYV